MRILNLIEISFRFFFNLNYQLSIIPESSTLNFTMHILSKNTSQFLVKPEIPSTRIEPVRIHVPTK